MVGRNLPIILAKVFLSDADPLLPTSILVLTQGCMLCFQIRHAPFAKARHDVIATAACTIELIILLTAMIVCYASKAQEVLTQHTDHENVALQSFSSALESVAIALLVFLSCGLGSFVLIADFYFLYRKRMFQASIRSTITSSHLASVVDEADFRTGDVIVRWLSEASPDEVDNLQQVLACCHTYHMRTCSHVHHSRRDALSSHMRGRGAYYRCICATSPSTCACV